MFQKLECDAEKDRNEESYSKQIKTNEKIERLFQELGPHLRPEQQTLLNETLIKIYPPNETSTDRKESQCKSWSYYNSFFFSFTIISTIGYGHQYPMTDS